MCRLFRRYICYATISSSVVSKLATDFSEVGKTALQNGELTGAVLPFFSVGREKARP